jgi:CheY-like chemotaxis protein
MPRKKSVLYCNDISRFGQRFNQVARRLKCEPTFVPSVEEAWRLIQSGQQFDLIVCDYKDREVDGLALLKQVRAHEATATTPFVLYSNTTDEDVPSEVATQNAVFTAQGINDQWDDLIPKWLLLLPAA